ncbi:MAG: hypothetical protein BA863_16055 [Desulfovibrio sp. S3730MH75]|nr:MAG: hypothetical protein BA863_16055 [Desulfovibrio sp. S3730MH75]
MTAKRVNPFEVHTPEGLDTKSIVELFVPEYTDYYKIPKVGHTFINGPRGSGKSMIFRYLMPDAQLLVNGGTLEDLEFFSVYVPIKETEPNLTELWRLEGKNANSVLNEHILATHFAIRLLVAIAEIHPKCVGAKGDNACESFHVLFYRLLARAGFYGTPPSFRQDENHCDRFGEIVEVLKDIHAQAIHYVRELSFSDTPPMYKGPLLGYLDFVVPLAQRIRELTCLPGAPIFFLVDDADNLSETQTKILNSWVSLRTTRDVSLKISTQLKYKSYLTVAEERIESPHDFSQINITDIYTTDRGRYLDRVRQMVRRRLDRAGYINVDPKDFFPENEAQEKAIENEKTRLIEAHKQGKGRGHRPNDDAIRYARPNYIKSLQEKRSGSVYSYAGFEQLVHVSSGVARFFLEPASQMYSEQIARNGNAELTYIEHAIQNEFIQKMANDFIYTEFSKVEKDHEKSGGSPERTTMLRNIISALGELFHTILVSDRSERRVFSIALTDMPDPEISAVFELGIQHGYFHKSSIGNKEGTGRTPLYILTRRLAPVFKLDPTSFAGYKFMTNEVLREAMQNPKSFASKARRNAKGGKDIDGQLDPPQLRLFEEG